MNRFGTAWLHPATWIALLALVVACSGTAYAAGLLGGEDIRNGSLTSADVKDGSLAGADIRDGSVRRRDLAAGVVPTFTTVQSTFENLGQPGDPTEGQAACPTGSRVIAGGYVVYPNTGPPVVRSYAISDTNWLVRVLPPDQNPFHVTIVVTCAS